MRYLILLLLLLTGCGVSPRGPERLPRLGIACPEHRICQWAEEGKPVDYVRVGKDFLIICRENSACVVYPQINRKDITVAP